MTDSKTATVPEAKWRELVWDEMRYRGYTDAEIKAAENQRCLDSACEWNGNSLAWDCSDEEGHSHHPVADELHDIMGVIERALEAISR